VPPSEQLLAHEQGSKTLVMFLENYYFQKTNKVYRPRRGRALLGGTMGFIFYIESEKYPRQ